MQVHLLVFRGYGTEMFNNIPVVVRSVNFTLPEDVDYVTVQTQNAGEIVAGRTVDRGNLDALGNDITNELQASKTLVQKIWKILKRSQALLFLMSPVPNSIHSIDLAPASSSNQIT